MILGSCQSLPIGHHGHGCTDPSGVNHPNQPFVIVRVATYEEFKDYMRSVGAKPMPAAMQAAIDAGRCFFYEVSVD